MIRLRALLIFGLFGMFPVAVHAQDGFIEWIDRLSGPGSFYGPVLGIRTLCTFEDPSKPDNSCLGDRNIKRTFVVRAGWLTSGDNKRFDDTNDRRPVHAIVFDPVYISRVHKTLDIGAGAGFFVFTGEGFDPLARFFVTPISVAFVPFGDTTSKWSRVLQVRFEEKLISSGYNGRQDFGTATSFSRGFEFVPSAAIVVNFGALQ
jgi:hypothetical protein